MLFQRLNRSDPEKVFIVVKNSYSTAAITVGQVVVFDYTTDQDGVGVTQPSAALLDMPAGIVETASIAAGEYGLIQVYGHNANALVDGTTGLVAGDSLKISDASFNLTKEATPVASAVGALFPGFVAGELYSTGAAAAKKVFIRLM
jgi:hypothetical protein